MLYLFIAYIIFGIALAIVSFIVGRHVNKYRVMSKRAPLILGGILLFVIALYALAGILIFQ
ncbi:hypothetical protein HON22_03865 [Candidatus Peregrinibacteria bacterium]|jgi:hypothetical protein|nr:hypothetical protein [Candidatus Peregrinibacteria bacterium]